MIKAHVDKSGKVDANAKRKAERVVDLVKDGMELKEAAKEVKLHPQELQRGSVRAILEDLLSVYHITPIAAREVVRAARNKILIQNLAEGGDEKLALEAAKQIASDPAVGLNAPPAPLVSIDLGSLSDLMEKADVVDVPEIEFLDNE